MSTIGVKEVNERINQTLTSNSKLKELNVVGEISGYKISGSHAYFKLKEDNYTLNCVIFTYKSKNISFVPKDGMKVICKGNISTYYQNGRSDYQLICINIEEAGEGKCKREFEELKLKLKSEGLFSKSRKKTIPKFPRKVGLATAYNSHAYNDLCKIGKSRYLGVKLIVSDCKVQGKDSPSSIINALRKLDNDSEIDVIILARGGGSLEELHCFNDEKLARYIASIKTPVVTGIGHEPDITIVDLVADLRCSTPSDAINRVVISKLEEEKELANLYGSILSSYNNLTYKMIENKNTVIDDINKYNIEQKLIDKKYNFENSMNSIHKLLINTFGIKKQKIETENEGIYRLELRLKEKLNKNQKEVALEINEVKNKAYSILNYKKKDINYINLENSYNTILDKIRNNKAQKKEKLQSIQEIINIKLSKLNRDIYLNREINALFKNTIKKSKHELKILNIKSQVNNFEIRLKSLILENENLNICIDRIAENIIYTNKKEKDSLIENIHHLGPEGILERGYSIILNEKGNVINSIEKLSENDLFEIKFANEVVKVNIKIIT